MLSVLMLLAAAATAQHPEGQAPKERPTRTKVVLLGTGTPVPVQAAKYYVRPAESHVRLTDFDVRLRDLVSRLK